MVNNIFCVGRNYVEHVNELKNVIPESPVIFSKPTHACIEANGSVIEIPADKGDVHYEAELVVKLKKDYEPNLSINELIGELTVGLDLTLRDLQQDLKEKGYPWLLSKGFKNSAVLGEFIEFPGYTASKEKNFSLFINGVKVQDGNIRKMIFDLEALTTFIGENLGLKKGDIIYTGTPQGVGVLNNNDEIVLNWGDDELGKGIIKSEPR